MVSAKRQPCLLKEGHRFRDVQSRVYILRVPGRSRQSRIRANTKMAWLSSAAQKMNQYPETCHEFMVIQEKSGDGQVK